MCCRSEHKIYFNIKRTGVWKLKPVSRIIPTSGVIGIFGSSELLFNCQVGLSLLRPPWPEACQASLFIGFPWGKNTEGISISFSRGLSWPRDWSRVSCEAESPAFPSLAGKFFSVSPPGNSSLQNRGYIKPTDNDFSTCLQGCLSLW